MDISDIWPLTKFFLPAVAACLIYLVAVRVRPRWLRLSVKFFASALFGCGALLLLGLMAVQVSCTKHPSSLYSPDRHYLAVISFALQGALGADYATVRVRHSWVPWATVVYSGPGAWDFQNRKPADPEVLWLDSAHLLISHYDEYGESLFCRSQAGAVHVACVRRVPPEIGTQAPGLLNPPPK